MKIFLFLFISLLPPLACYAQEKSVCLVITEAGIQTGFLVDTDLVLTTAQPFYRSKAYFNRDYIRSHERRPVKGVVLFGSNPDILVKKIRDDLKDWPDDVVCRYYNSTFGHEVRLYPITSVGLSEKFDPKTHIHNIAELWIGRTESNNAVPIEIISEEELEAELAVCDGIDHLRGYGFFGLYERNSTFRKDWYPLNYVPFFKETYSNWDEHNDPCLKLFRNRKYIDRELTPEQKHGLETNPHFFPDTARLFLSKGNESLGNLVYKDNKAYGIITHASQSNMIAPYGLANLPHRLTHSVYTVTPLWLTKVQKGLRWVSKAL